jgi:hypothetical protein
MLTDTAVVRLRRSDDVGNRYDNYIKCAGQMSWGIRGALTSDPSRATCVTIPTFYLSASTTHVKTISIAPGTRTKGQSLNAACPIPISPQPQPQEGEGWQRLHSITITRSSQKSVTRDQYEPSTWKRQQARILEAELVALGLFKLGFFATSTSRSLLAL